MKYRVHVPGLRQAGHAVALMTAAALAAACGDPIASPSEASFARAPGSNPGTPQSCFTNGVNGNSKNEKNQCVFGYSIGGSITGLQTGKSVVLQNNGGDDLTVSASGGFTFATPIADGGSYAVTVKTEPVNQRCYMDDYPNPSSGTVAGANVTNVQVECYQTVLTVQNQLTAGGVYVSTDYSGILDCAWSDDYWVLAGTTDRLAGCPLSTSSPSTFFFRLVSLDNTGELPGAPINVQVSGATCAIDRPWNDAYDAGGRTWKCTVDVSGGLPATPVAVTVTAAPPA
jgi:hypothetical protein